MKNRTMRSSCKPSPCCKSGSDSKTSIPPRPGTALAIQNTLSFVFILPPSLSGLKGIRSIRQGQRRIRTPIHRRTGLTHESRAARLDGLDLSQLNWGTSEPRRELGAIEVHSLGSQHRSHRRTRGATNACLLGLDCLTEGTELLGMVSVGAEGSVGAGRGL
jgi:hypothetical protein